MALEPPTPAAVCRLRLDACGKCIGGQPTAMRGASTRRSAQRRTQAGTGNLAPEWPVGPSQPLLCGSANAVDARTGLAGVG